MLNFQKRDKNLTEAVEIVYDESDDDNEEEIERKIRTIFDFVDEDWVIQQLKDSLLNPLAGDFVLSDGAIDAMLLSIAARNDAKHGKYGINLSYPENIYLDALINEVLAKLVKRGVITYYQSEIFNLGNVAFTNDFIRDEIKDFSLDEVYDTSKHHSYHDWRREVVNPIVDEIVQRFDRSWLVSMIAREQMERTLTDLVPRIDIDFAIDAKAWIELNTFGDAKEDPNLIDIYQFVKNAAKLHVYNLLDELETVGVIETVKKFGSNRSEFFMLTKEFIEKETSGFNLDEGKNFSDISACDKRLISIIKKEHPPHFVEKLIIKELVDKRNTSSDINFRILIRRNVALVLCANEQLSDVSNIINEYVEYVINSMCVDGKLIPYIDKQTGHNMIKLNGRSIKRESKRFNLDETLRKMIRGILS